MSKNASSRNAWEDAVKKTKNQKQKPKNNSYFIQEGKLHELLQIKDCNFLNF